MWGWLHATQSSDDILPAIHTHIEAFTHSDRPFQLTIPPALIQSTPISLCSHPTLNMPRDPLIGLVGKPSSGMLWPRTAVR